MKTARAVPCRGALDRFVERCSDSALYKAPRGSSHVGEAYERSRRQYSSGLQPAHAIRHLHPKWLSELRSRIGKCILFGLKPHQTAEAGRILEETARDWRELMAGSEGFLTSPDSRGLYRQQVVWGEQQGHVNNVIYNRYAESARVNWIHKFGQKDPAHAERWAQLMAQSTHGLILRSIKTDYKFPMTYPDSVTVYHKLRSEPSAETDSFVLDVVVLSERHRRPAARCVEDLVVYDYTTGKKTPLAPFMVDQFKSTFAAQEQAKRKYGARITKLLESLRKLETDSWDRPDAQEDFGGGSS